MNTVLAITISLLIGMIVSCIIYFKKDKSYKTRWKYLTSAFRGLSTAMIVFLLLAPHLQYTSNDKKKPVIIWLQDNTESIRNGLKDELETFESRQKAILDQLHSDYQVEVYQFGENLIQDKTSAYDQKITQLDFALQNTINRYQNDNLGAVILASDGIYNRGSDPNYSVANKNHTHIYTVALGDSSTPKDISIQRVYANKIVTAGNEFEIAFDIKFSQFVDSRHSIHLYQNGKVVKSKQQSITEQNAIIAESFILTTDRPGIHHFQIHVPVADGEVTEVNNTFDFFIEFISNEIKILVVNNGAHPDIGFIGNALKQAKGFKYDIAPAQSLPEDFSRYDILILHQPQLNPALWKKIADAKIPAWHIIGNQTSQLQLELINTFFNVRSAQSSIPFQNISVSSQFNLFRLPLSAQDVMKKMPPLESRVNTLKTGMPAEVCLKNDQSDIWVFSSLHPVAVTIGEGIWKWGIYEQKDFKSNIITHELIQQTLHTLKKPNLDKSLNVYLNKRLLTDQEHVAVSAEVRNKNGQMVNTPEAALLIENEKGYKEQFTFDRLGNSYHMLIPPLEAGEYNYTAETVLDGKKHLDKGVFVIENIPLEYMNTQADYSLLYNLAANNNGKMYTIDNMLDITREIDSNDKITTIIKSESVNNLWIHYKWLFFFIMALLTIEWFVRKYFAMQ